MSYNSSNTLKILTFIFLLVCSSAQAESILLPSEQFMNISTTHVFPWRFYRQFGYFPDRDGAVINCLRDECVMRIDRDLTDNEKQAVIAFFENENNYVAPPGWHRLQFFIDYDGMVDRIKQFIENNNLDLDIVYIGNGIYQNIYFSRDLAVQEKAALKNLLMSYWSYE